MASSRPNSESQDGSVELRNQRLRDPKQISSEVQDENIELPNGRFKVSKLVSPSENRQSGVGFENFRRNVENAPGPILHRSASSNDMLTRHLPERPKLQRTISSFISMNNTTSNTQTPRTDTKKRNVGSKNGNMVLQLVLPSNNQIENGNYLTNTSIDEILGGTNNRRRSIGSQQDVYSTVGTECYVNQAFTNDLADYDRNFPHPQTPVSMASTSDHAKSTSPEDKARFFRKYITTILSSMYALFIVTLGIVIYISDVLIGDVPMAEIFSLYLVIIAFLFIFYLIIDIRRYMNKRNYQNDLLENNVAEEVEIKEAPNGGLHLNIKLPEAVRQMKELEHHYCLSKDRHSGNFYLKVGAAGFCVGHLIHSGLLIGYQVLFLTSDGDAFYECASVASLVLDILYPLYSFLLLYFIFKYSNVVVNRHVAFIRFGMMHCLASSVCFWVWTILRETVEALSNHHYEQEEEEENSKDDHENFSTVSEIGFFTGKPVALPLNSYNRRGAKLLTAYLNSSVRQFVGECSNDAGMSTIYRNYSPYLYPFSVEYSILVVGVLFVIWQSIGKCKEKEEMSSTLQCDSPVGNNDNLESNLVVHVDCHSANKGLFCGIVIMVITAVSVILFLIAVNDSRYENGAIIINIATSIIITCLMTITCIFAYRQITKLDISNHHISFLDDLLLFICMPAYFLNAIITLIPASFNQEIASIFVQVLEIIQILLQTSMIMDGLRRCSNNKKLRKKKPGRELLTFLIVCNIAMWIMQTFEVKSHDLTDHRNEFYGEELWTIIGHLCVPLMMFYRFHSSVCLVDIWKYAYEPNDH